MVLKSEGSEEESHGKWMEFGRTEVKKNDANPIYIESFYFQANQTENMDFKI